MPQLAVTVRPQMVREIFVNETHTHPLELDRPVNFYLKKKRKKLFSQNVVSDPNVAARPRSFVWQFPD